MTLIELYKKMTVVDLFCKRHWLSFNKIKKKYDKLINILGADHIGYIKRISAAVTAISNNKISLTCKVCQLVKFMKNGQPFKMSKRSGDFFPLKKLLKKLIKTLLDL